MRAISLWQPYGSLWFTERKPHETRHWRTEYRGWLAVHVAKRAIDPPDDLDEVHRICVEEFGADYRATLPRGSFIGALKLVDCQPMRSYAPDHDDDLQCGHWSGERFAWRRGEHKLLTRPLPFKGQQGFWNIPDNLLRDHEARAA